MPSISRKQFIGGAAIGLAVALYEARAWLGQQDDEIDRASFDGDFRELSSTIADAMAAFGIPGLASALITQSENVWTHAFGVADAATNKPLTTRTIFQAASLTKPLFAYAVLGLVDRKMLDLDQSIAPHLSKEAIRKDSRLTLVTPRMLLSHTSGIAAAPDAPSLNFVPGERFEYSPAGFQVMQTVAERLTGMSLTQFMRSNALEPCGMGSSSVGWTITQWLRAAQGHFSNGKSRRNRLEWYPSAAGSLLTTAGDYARFMQRMLKPAGSGTSGELKREMLKPQVRIMDDLAWGLGWGLEGKTSTHAFWHWGDQNNFNNFALMDVARGIGIVILTNSANGAHAYDAIVRSAIGGEHPALSWLGMNRE